MEYTLGQVCAIVGGQWGDEGKGKLVDILAEDFDVIVRATGGANAGHTIYVDGKKFVFHLVPSGMFHAGKICVMGNGMVVHLPTLIEEMETLRKAGVKTAGRLFLSDRAHLVFDYHKTVDRLQEAMKGAGKVGTTGRGIGPAYMDKTGRIGVRAGELKDFDALAGHYRRNVAMAEKIYGFSHDAPGELRELKKIAKRITPLLADTSLKLAQAMEKKKRILLEGANGTLLDIDHGTFPFVTSSNASIGGVIAGSGVAPSSIKSAIGIMKAYVTRVGSGPFPTELTGALGEKIRTAGSEFGATTGRPRRCGWFDAVAARYSVRLNGFTAINLTKLDVLSTIPRLKIAVAYHYKGKRVTEFPSDSGVLEACRPEYVEMSGWTEDIAAVRSFGKLPAACRAYVLRLEELMGRRIAFIGTGKGRQEMILR